MSEFDAPLSTVLRVADLLWRARGEHVARLVDVETLADGGVRLVLEDGSVPLANLLGRGLALGEAVTILVPLAECVEALPRAGVIHGAIAPASVRLDGRGAPILGAFETARPVGRHAVDEGLDRGAFRELAGVVLAEVDDAPATRGALLTDLAAVDASKAGSLAAFAERLLSAARPEPVRLDRPAVAPPQAPPARGTESAGPRRPRPWASWRGSRTAMRLGRVRRRFWIPAGVAVLGLVAALVLLPGDPGQVRTEPSAPELLVTTAPGPVDAVRDADPVRAALRLRADATGATVVDDYGDVVLLALQTTAGDEQILIERTGEGWRLRDLLSTAG